MKKYEVMYILKANLEDATRQATIDSLNAIITNDGGVIESTDEWGLREFAYEIDGMTKGYYVVTTYTIDTDGLNEFKRLLGINADVVRDMTINTAEKAGK